MLSLLGPAVIKALVDGFLGKALEAFTAYQNKQISLAELNVKLQESLMATFAEVEKSHAESLTKTYESFQVTMRQSPIVQQMWSWVVATQLVVLLWHQMGIPAVVYFTGHDYPSSGSTVEWAYALIGFMFGAGALLLRTGPGAGSTLAKLKSAIGK